MHKSETLADLFPDRKAKLRAIRRYGAFDTMLYRTDDWIHSLRVRWIVDDLIPLAEKHFKRLDSEKAVCLALVHDDPEIVMGDIQAGHKAVMSKKALAEVHREELRAIALLGKRYPAKIGNYEYGRLLLEGFKKETLEAQLVSYADKMDAYCESVHELYAGNFSLMRSVIFYNTLFAQAEKKFPRLKPMLGDARSVFTDLRLYLKREWSIRGANYAMFGRPFTRATLKKRTQFPFYERWRELNLERGGEEGRDALLRQKEFRSRASRSQR